MVQQNHKRQFSGLPEAQANNLYLQRMILASFQTVPSSTLKKMRSIEVDVEVNTVEKTFNLRVRANAMREKEGSSSCTIKGVPIESRGNWNFLLIHFAKKNVLEVVLKGASEQQQKHQAELRIDDSFSGDKANYFMALGNYCDMVINKHAESADDSSTRSRSKSYFRGCVSLPFFFRGVSEFKKMFQ